MASVRDEFGDCTWCHRARSAGHEPLCVNGRQRRLDEARLSTFRAMIRAHRERAAEVLVAYKRDLYGFDRIALQEAPVGARFVWVLRECGSDIAFSAGRVEPPDPLLRLKDSLSFMEAVIKHRTEPRAFFFGRVGNGRLVETTREQALVWVQEQRHAVSGSGTQSRVATRTTRSRGSS